VHTSDLTPVSVPLAQLSEATCVPVDPPEPLLWCPRLFCADRLPGAQHRTATAAPASAILLQSLTLRFRAVCVLSERSVQRAASSAATPRPKMGETQFRSIRYTWSRLGTRQPLTHAALLRRPPFWRQKGAAECKALSFSIGLCALADCRAARIARRNETLPFSLRLEIPGCLQNLGETLRLFNRGYCSTANRDN
jgi:hypothetical protein